MVSPPINSKWSPKIINIIKMAKINLENVYLESKTKNNI
jgi:hypothetical protein